VIGRIERFDQHIRQCIAEFLIDLMVDTPMHEPLTLKRTRVRLAA
jgi:hypothetical protein